MPSYLHDKFETTLFVFAFLILRFHTLSFFIDREVTIVNVFGCILRVGKKACVRGIRKGRHKLLQGTLVLLFKHLCELTLFHVVFIVDAVAIHVVDKEQ